MNRTRQLLIDRYRSRIAEIDNVLDRGASGNLELLVLTNERKQLACELKDRFGLLTQPRDVTFKSETIRPLNPRSDVAAA